MIMKKTKFNKQSRNLLISLLLGDGTICKNHKTGDVNMKIHKKKKKKEYAEWKAKKLDEFGIPNSGVVEYKMKTNFTHGEKWSSYVCRIKNSMFIKVLRRVIYVNDKKQFSRKLLNRVDALGLAIWYMDDGSLNFKKHTLVDGSKKIHGLFLRISTCLPKEQAQIYIDWLKENWGINFYIVHEGKRKDSYSLCCGTNEAIKFMNIIKPYVDEVPSMKYKITYDLSHRGRLPIGCTSEQKEMHSTQKSEDIV